MQIFDIRRIIIENWKYLNASTHKINLALIFFISPIILTTTLIFFKMYINNTFVDTLTNFSGIIIGFIVALLGIIYSAKISDKKELRKQLITNSMYTIIIGILLVVFLLYAIISAFASIAVLSFIVYMITIHFFLMILIVFKRIYALMN